MASPDLIAYPYAGRRVASGDQERPADNRHRLCRSDGVHLQHRLGPVPAAVPGPRGIGEFVEVPSDTGPGADRQRGHDSAHLAGGRQLGHAVQPEGPLVRGGAGGGHGGRDGGAGEGGRAEDTDCRV